MPNPIGLIKYIIKVGLDFSCTALHRRYAAVIWGRLHSHSFYTSASVNISRLSVPCLPPASQQEVRANQQAKHDLHTTRSRLQPPLTHQLLRSICDNSYGQLWPTKSAIKHFFLIEMSKQLQVASSFCLFTEPCYRTFLLFSKFRIIFNDLCELS